MIIDFLWSYKLSKNKSTETELPNMEVKRESLIGCDAITQISRQNSLEFIIESLHFIKADNHVGTVSMSYLLYVYI